MGRHASVTLIALWDGVRGVHGGVADMVEAARICGVKTIILDAKALFALPDADPASPLLAGKASDSSTTGWTVENESNQKVRKRRPSAPPETAYVGKSGYKVPVVQVG